MAQSFVQYSSVSVSPTFDFCKYFINKLPLALIFLLPILSASLCPVKEVRFLTSPSLPPHSTWVSGSSEAGGQVGSSIASRYDIWCSINQNNGIKIFRITQKSLVCGWDTNLMDSESSGWNGIQGRYVHIHPIYLHLWKLSWIKQAFFTTLALGLALLKTNLSQWEGSDIFAKKAEPPGSLKAGPVLQKSSHSVVEKK